MLNAFLCWQIGTIINNLFISIYILYADNCFSNADAITLHFHYNVNVMLY